VQVEKYCAGTLDIEECIAADEGQSDEKSGESV
jgi:hypothetical protein